MACGCSGDSNQWISFGGFFLFGSQWSDCCLLHMHFHGCICWIYHLSCFPSFRLLSSTSLPIIKVVIEHGELIDQSPPRSIFSWENSKVIRIY